MLLPVHQVGLSFTTIPGHSICTSTSQTIQISTSTAILGRSADVPLLGFMKRFMPTEALFLFSLPLLLIFISHSPTTWPTGLHKCAIGRGEGLFTIVESSNNIARFRLCSCHIPDPRIILPIAIGAEQHDLLPDPFSVCCAPRGSSKRRSQDGLIRPVTECRVQESRQSRQSCHLLNAPAGRGESIMSLSLAYYKDTSSSFRKNRTHHRQFYHVSSEPPPP
jgi:hypothetical protein